MGDVRQSVIDQYGSTGNTTHRISEQDLSGCDLSRLGLSGINLGGKKLQDTSFHRSALAYAYLADADMRGADLSWTTLLRANLAGANLAGANLFSASLLSADLTGANLADANVTLADFGGATLPDGSVYEQGMDMSSFGVAGTAMTGDYALDMTALDPLSEDVLRDTPFAGHGPELRALMDEPPASGPEAGLLAEPTREAPADGPASEPDVVRLLLEHGPEGSATVARFEIDDGPIAAIVVHEDEHHVLALPEEPDIRTRMGVIDGGSAITLVVLALIEGEHYETWWNYYGPGQVLFHDMARQDRLMICFVVDDPEPRRVIWGPNNYRSAFAEAITRMESHTPWTMAEFDRAKEALYHRFPSVQALWDSLGNASV